MATYSEEITARYRTVEREPDALGRRIGVHRLRPSQELKLQEMTPLLEGETVLTTDAGEKVSVSHRSPARVAAAVCEIDGEPIPFPKNRAELDATVDMLDQEGMQAAMVALARLHATAVGPGKDGQVAAAKN